MNDISNFQTYEEWRQHQAELASRPSATMEDIYTHEDFLSAGLRPPTSSKCNGTQPPIIARRRVSVTVDSDSEDSSSSSFSISPSSPSSPITSDTYSDIFEHYNVSTTVLGRGHYGAVRECTHRTTGVKYAVKTIDKRKVSRHDHIAREVQLLRSVNHPHIMQMIDCFEDTTYVHIITEICNGGELFDMVVDNTHASGCLPEEQARRIIKSLLQSVQYLHSKDIVHRDIKPENLLLSTTNGQGDTTTTTTNVKLIDFGLARIHTQQSNTFMTNQVGTSYYMSPEIHSGKYDRSCDIWAIGIVSYILLAGYPPFNGDNDDEVQRSTQVGYFIFERQVWEKLSMNCRDFVYRLICSNEDKRIVSAEEALYHPWMMTGNV